MRLSEKEAPPYGENQPKLDDPIRLSSLPEGVLLIGAPGSGKGTVGRVLHRIDGFVHVSSGDVIRRSLAAPHFDCNCHERVSQGELLDDSRLWKLFDAHVSELNVTANRLHRRRMLVLDGVPRTIAQVDELAKRVQVRAVLYFECSDFDVLQQRLSYRSVTEGRADDSAEEVIRNRFRVFEQETLPILNAYPACIIHRINATLRPSHVLSAALALLEEFV